AVELSTKSAASMPAWWDVYGFNSGRRDGFVVDAYPPVVATPACEPWYLGSTLETNYDWRYPTADVARLVIQGRVSSAAVIEGHRYLACRLLLNLGGTAGCAGCLEPIDITV